MNKRYSVALRYARCSLRFACPLKRSSRRRSGGIGFLPAARLPLTPLGRDNSGSACASLAT